MALWCIVSPINFFNYKKDLGVDNFFLLEKQNLKSCESSANILYQLNEFIDNLNEWENIVPLKQIQDFIIFLNIVITFY